MPQRFAASKESFELNSIKLMQEHLKPFIIKEQEDRLNQLEKKIADLEAEK